MANIEIDNIISQKLSGSLSQLGDGSSSYLTVDNDDFILQQDNNQFVVETEQSQNRIEFKSEAVSGESYNESGTSVTVALPSGTEKDDFLLAIVSYRITSESTQVDVVPPRGWFEIAKSPHLGSGNNFIGTYVYGKAAHDNEPLEYTWGFSATIRPVARILRISNVNISDPVSYAKIEDIVTSSSTIALSDYLSSNIESLLVTFTTLARSESTSGNTSDISGNKLTDIQNFLVSFFNVGHNQEAAWRLIKNDKIGEDITFSVAGSIGCGAIILNPKNKSDERSKEHIFKRGRINPYQLTLPKWASVVELDVVGGGGGGGSGRRSDIQENKRGGVGGTSGFRTTIRKSANELLKAHPKIVCDYHIHKNGDISSSGANVVIASGSPCPGVLNVDLPIGAKIIGVDTSYNITAVNSAWMDEQRSFIRAVGGEDDEVQIGAGSVEGTFSYTRDYLPIANSIEGGGTITFELHVGRTWPNANDTTCNTTYQFVPNNEWTVTVHYIDPTTSAPMQITVGEGGSGGAARSGTNNNGLPGGDGEESFVAIGNMSSDEVGPTVMGETVFGNPTENAFTTSFSLGVPSGTKKGDLILAIVGGRSPTTNQGAIAVEDGWTVLADIPRGSAERSPIYAAYRTDAEDGDTFEFTTYVGATSPSGSCRWVGRLIRIVDFDPENPIAVVHAAFGPQNTSTTMNSSPTLRTDGPLGLRITSLNFSIGTSPPSLTTDLSDVRLLDAINQSGSVGSILHTRHKKHSGPLYEVYTFSHIGYLSIIDLVINPIATKIASAPGGLGGAGGTTGFQSNAAVAWQHGDRPSAGSSSITTGGNAGSGVRTNHPGSGGGGANLNSFNMSYAGGNGGDGFDILISNTTSGAGGAAGSNGEDIDQDVGQMIPGSGGGGGGSDFTSAGRGGHGARGSGGGGGGGAVGTSGAGGDGGDGYVIVRIY